jgi:hypothetical protein
MEKVRGQLKWNPHRGIRCVDASRALELVDLVIEVKARF